MPLVLLDTNILLRGTDPGDPMFRAAEEAVQNLRARGDLPCLVPQIIVEFRAVATRPAPVNGLGMTQVDAGTEIRRILRLFPLLDEVSAIFTEWRNLVGSCGATGKQNHDARIAAAMRKHGISTILTFNKSDFTRYPGITVLEPADLVSSTPS